MANKPETTFIGSIHRLIPQVYAEKMNNPFRAGTADVWYSGELGDLWVEYKFIERIPDSKEIVPDLSPRQVRWLGNRLDEGRNVAVVLGTPTGGVVYRRRSWLIPQSKAELEARLMTRAQLAQWILDQVGASKCNSLT